MTSRQSYDVDFENEDDDNDDEPSAPSPRAKSSSRQRCKSAALPGRRLESSSVKPANGNNRGNNNDDDDEDDKKQSARPQTANAVRIKYAEQESAMKRVYLNPLTADSRHGERVIAKCEEDGFYYRAIIVACPDSQSVCVEFDNAPLKRARLSTEQVIPTIGAVARPSIRQNDTVLVQTRNYATEPSTKAKGLVCFLPGIVVSTPVVYEPHQAKFYGVLLYNQRSMMACRNQLFRITEQKYQSTVAYINERSRLSGVRAITSPKRGQVRTVGVSANLSPNMARRRCHSASAAAHIEQRIEKMVSESPFNQAPLMSLLLRNKLRQSKDNEKGLLSAILANEKRVNLSEEPQIIGDGEHSFTPMTNQPERISSPYLSPSSNSSGNQNRDSQNMTFAEFRQAEAEKRRVKSAGLKGRNPPKSGFVRPKSAVVPLAPIQAGRSNSPRRRRSPVGGSNNQKLHGASLSVDGSNNSDGRKKQGQITASLPGNFDPKPGSNLATALAELKAGNSKPMESALINGIIKVSEQLGDAVRELDVVLGLVIYAKLGNRAKIDDILREQASDYGSCRLLKAAMPYDAGACLVLAQCLVDDGTDIGDIVDTYLEGEYHDECVDFLLSVLDNDDPLHNRLQTRLLAIAFAVGKHKAEKILTSGRFSKYDRSQVAQLCESNGLYELAIENCDSPKNVRQILRKHTTDLKMKWLGSFFSKMQDFDQVIEALREMLMGNSSDDENDPKRRKIVFWLLETFYSQWETGRLLVDLFNSDDSTTPNENGVELCRRLEQLRRMTKNDAGLNTFYIEAACFGGKVGDAEAACKDASFNFNGEAVRDFLMLARKPSLYRLLIFVCDRFNFVEQLVRFLNDNGQSHLVEAYVAILNPSRQADVVQVMRKLADESKGARRSKIEDDIAHLQSLIPDGQYNKPNTNSNPINKTAIKNKAF